MDKQDQTALIQIGILLKEFIEPGELPDGHMAYSKIMQDNLGIEIKPGDPICGVRDRVVAAIKERDEMLTIGEQFFRDWLEEDLCSTMAAEISKEIDNALIIDLKEIAHELNFDSAMKGL